MGGGGLWLLDRGYGIRGSAEMRRGIEGAGVVPCLLASGSPDVGAGEAVVVPARRPVKRFLGVFEGKISAAFVDVDCARGSPSSVTLSSILYGI